MGNPIQDPFFSSITQDPFFKGFDLTNLRRNTAIGRASTEQENIDANIQRLKAITPANQQQADRIKRLLASLETQKGGGSTRTLETPLSEPMDMGEPITIPSEQETGRGIVAGVRTAAPWMADLALTLPSLVPGPTQAPIQNLRAQLQEKIQQNREEVDPRGPGGIAGEVIGGSVALGKPLGLATEGVAGALGIAERLAPGANASTIAKIRRAIYIRVAAGLPLNVTQALSLPEGTPLGERLKVLGITTGAEALGGILGGPARTKEEFAAGQRLAPPPGGGVAAGPDRAAQLEATSAAIEARKAKLIEISQARVQAKAEWQVANPGKKWTDLSAEARNQEVQNYLERQRAKGPPPPEAGPPLQAAVPPTIPPVPSGGEAVAAGPTAPVGVEAPVVAPTAEPAPSAAPPLTPLDQKLADLKAKMASGQQPTTPQGPGMKVDEINEFPHYQEPIPNFLGRLGSLRSDVQQHILQNEIDGIKTPYQGMDPQAVLDMVDKRVERYKTNSTIYGMTPKEVQSYIDAKQWKPLEQIQREYVLKEQVDAHEIGAMVSLVELPNPKAFDLKTRTIAELTGETQGQVADRLRAQIPDYLAKELESAQKALNYWTGKKDETNIKLYEGQVAKYNKLLDDFEGKQPKKKPNPGNQLPKKGIGERARDLTEELKKLPKPPGHEGPDVWWEMPEARGKANMYGLPDVPWEDLTIGQKNRVADVWGTRATKLSPEQINEFIDAWEKNPGVYGPKAEKYYGPEKKQPPSDLSDVQAILDRPPPLGSTEIADAIKWWQTLSGDKRAEYRQEHFPDKLYLEPQDIWRVWDNVHKGTTPRTPEVEAAKWWRQLHPMDKDELIAGTMHETWEGLTDEERAQVTKAFDEFTARAGGQSLTGQNKDQGLSPQDVGIIGASAPRTAKDWWDYVSVQSRASLVDDYLSATHGDMTDQDFGALVHAKWEKLSPEFQSAIEAFYEKNKVGGETVVNVGKTVEEPSGSARLAGVRFPPDLRDELTNFLIDSYTGKWPPEEFATRLEDFAAQHELNHQQIQAGLKELGYHPPEVGQGGVGSTSTTEVPATGAEPAPSITEKRFSTLTTEELDAAKEAQFKALEANPADQQALQTLQELAAETRSRTGEPPQRVEPRSFGMPGDEMVQALNRPVEPSRPRMDPKLLAKLAKTSPRKLSDDELNGLITEVGHRIAELPQGFADDWYKLLDKLSAERTLRQPPQGPIQANLPPSVLGAALGATYGMWTSDDENKTSNTLLYAAIGGVGGHVLGKLVTQSHSPRAHTSELYPGQHTLPKPVVYLDERKQYRPPWLTTMRHFYDGSVRGIGEIEHVYEKAGAGDLSAWLSAAKKAAIFGRWVSKAESALETGMVIEVNGHPVKLPGLPPHKQQEIVNGDIVNLDELAVARTVLEQMTINPNRSYPMDRDRAMITFRAAPENYHQAADEMRQYALSGVKVAADAGLITSANIPAFANEMWYASLRRVFGPGVERKDLRDIITSPQPIKARTFGSTEAVISPFESQIEMVPRLIRASEYNSIKRSFIAFVKSQSEETQKYLMTRSETKANKMADIYTDQVNAIRKIVPELDPESAYQLAISMGEQVSKASPHLTVYEDGVLKSYLVQQSLFQAFQSMTPYELSGFFKLAGKANLAASKGVVNHPWFIGMQAAVVEPMQAALQSSYGFVPYYDNIRGWWHAFSGSDTYKMLQSVGGVGSIQSLPYATAEGAIKAARTGGSTPLEKTVNNIREFRPFEAWKAITAPFAEAARTGEALRALAHGESPVDAAYAAWHVLGNTRMEGSMSAMRGFNQLTLFSRPAISALDELATKTGLNPFREPRVSHSSYANFARSLGVTNNRVISGTELVLKGFAYLTLPAMWLWYHNKDDAEIQQLRQTESGQRYFFFRTPDNSIGKIRKPHVIGEMFASTAEAALDKVYGTQGNNGLLWLDGLINDAQFNILPQFGVIPASLISNKQWGSPLPIVPGNENIDTNLAGDIQSSLPSRYVADKLQPMTEGLDPRGFWTGALRRATTPAGLDFIANNAFGILGQDALRAADVALKSKEEGLIPTKEELPIVGRFFAKYPSMATRNVRDFYDFAGRAEIATNSLHDIARNNPELFARYLDKHLPLIQSAPLATAGRQQIANLLRAVQEMKELLSRNQITAEEYRRTEKEMLTQIINLTGQYNEAAKQARQLVPTP